MKESRLPACRLPAHGEEDGPQLVASVPRLRPRVPTEEAGPGPTLSGWRPHWSACPQPLPPPLKSVTPRFRALHAPTAGGIKSELLGNRPGVCPLPAAGTLPTGHHPRPAGRNCCSRPRPAAGQRRVTQLRGPLWAVCRLPSPGTTPLKSGYGFSVPHGNLYPGGLREGYFTDSPKARDPGSPAF